MAMMSNLMLRAGGQLVVMLAICSVVSFCEAGPPVDPVGSWKLCCVCPDGRSRDCVINVSRDGRSLKASYNTDGVTRDARSVVFDRGKLSVQVDGEFGGSRYKLTYEGRPIGDTLCGDVHWSYLWASGTFAFKGERMVERGVAAR